MTNVQEPDVTQDDEDLQELPVVGVLRGEAGVNKSAAAGGTWSAAR